MMQSLPVRQFPYEHREYIPTRGGAGIEHGDGEWVPYRVSEPGKSGPWPNSQRFARRSIASSGLRVVEPVRFGLWCGRTTGSSNQDIVVLASLRQG